MSRKKPAIDFEKSLVELEKIVRTLEQGELPLEASLEAFERGIHLTRECQIALQQAEQKVQLLLNKNGQPELIPFDEEQSS